MASRHRDLIPAIPDRENVTSKPPKAHLTKPTAITKRPALNELGNKLNNAKCISKKADAVKEPQPLLKAPQGEIKKENVVPSKGYSLTQIESVIEQSSGSDPQMVSEYTDDIYEYLQELEVKYSIKKGFLDKHESSPRMRAILVNWLVQVHQNFGLCLETLHMCVSIIDRYLQDNTQVGRESLQLVGTAALLVACKYEEIFVPCLTDFEYICDKSFSLEQILDMEKSILISLNYTLGKPLPIHFLRRYSKLARVRLEEHNLSKYLLELALLNHDMSHIKPSLQAAAACCLSKTILNNLNCPMKIWTSELSKSTGYKYSEFQHVVFKFANLLLNANSSKQKYIPNKYAEAKYNKVSTNQKLKGVLVKRLAGMSQSPPSTKK